MFGASFMFFSGFYLLLIILNLIQIFEASFTYPYTSDFFETFRIFKAFQILIEIIFFYYSRFQ